MYHYVNRFPRPKLSAEQVEEERRLRALLREQEAAWDEDEEDNEEPSTWQAPQTPEEDEALMASFKRLIGGGR